MNLLDQIEAEQRKNVPALKAGQTVRVHAKVIEGEKGLFIAMPSRKAGDGDFRDIAHPINSATRDQIQGLILKKYEEVLQEKE